MVSRPRRALIALVCLGLAGAPALGSGPDVREALKRGQYPWYGAKDDALKPVPPPVGDPQLAAGPRTGWATFRWSDLGQLVAFLLVAAALGAVVVGVVWAWRRHLETEPLEGPRAAPGVRDPSRVGQLPPGLNPEVSDLWAEAARLRDRGDYAEAVLYLFVHQLVMLQKLGLTRLAPGKTARQLVRGVRDPDARGRVEPTLRLFEASYYGHRPPSRESFEAVWAEAEALERRTATGVSP